MNGLFDNLRLRVVTALLLAMICLQATPLRAVVQVDQGPAFSVSSVDVSLAPRRESTGELRAQPVPLPATPPAVVPALRHTSSVSQDWALFERVSLPRAPPRSLPSARAPPFS